ncbi:peptidase M15B and M15C DD-carboxypeptidase VanY/endolysin [Catenulispora acidiphila DSM 44928]|uniref:Peptidase M15B and M15C DD-carboxypeptidase VanY/endolysin n=1 Tax=Catenulispora acidiphila (strain DSM 44928 / JCM 14897 / NBRC 102108 / NRRL B-24433 / ID139908) TaxID=479433 RepID=C7QJI8_CATAD|nr:D-alanyl-D-alanine carboxypeptidase family protein [Catenulispora acidiphila]ACU71211.1 peptidase M15B and M15C DD-carboxypeptidase VanY/endolysin [Catenulispora acidiphila DSM 44928]
MEQRDQTPREPAAEDIGRAAAEAAAQAEAGDDFAHGPQADRYGSAGYREPGAARSPRRWLVIGGVTVAALAVAGTAGALAGRAHPAKHDTALNAAASSNAQSPTPPATSDQTTPTTDPTTPPAPTSTSTTPPPATAAKTPSPTPKPTPTKSPSTAPTNAPAGEGGDCENATHDTPADIAKNFSGMTRSAQTAFLAAQKDAKTAGLTFLLNSGYRSATYQQRVFDCWVAQLGSPQAARQYALPPNESAHVQGYAMDIAPPSAASWLEATKGKYGLCRRYADETWHFEYQSRYKTQGCPSLLPHP